jgi:hypothetical protein
MGEGEGGSSEEEAPGNSRHEQGVQLACQGLHCHHGGCSSEGLAACCAEEKEESTINSPLTYNTENMRRTESPTGEGEGESLEVVVPEHSRRRQGDQPVFRESHFQESHFHHGGCF